MLTLKGPRGLSILAFSTAVANSAFLLKSPFTAALRKAKIDSPRGPFTLSKNHDPVQDFYLRQVVGKENKSIGIAAKGLSDPGRGCNM